MMEILHQTIHQLKVCDNTHILYSTCMSTCTAMLHSFMLCTCLCFIIGSDNEDDSTSSSNESHEVNGDTSNGEESEGGENSDGDTPPNNIPAQGV